MPHVMDDAWLAELLQYRPDAATAAQLAPGLAQHYPDVDPGGLVSGSLREALDQVWERGWQPADVAHAARRDATTGSVPLVVTLMADHARRTDAARRAPEAWVEQLRELDALEGGDAPVVAAWQRSARRGPADAWRIVLQLLGVLRGAARIDALVPPPSRWGAARTGPVQAPAGGDDRALRRIRGLLAKAESTEFAEEAEALTAKAQELMTRHAVDAALLDPGASSGGASGGEVGTRRVHVADPYVRAKMQLLAAVAEANDVRLVWYQGLGIANLVGRRADLDAVELLFTSLLLQVAQALGAAERQAGRRSASRTFRRAFLLGYGQRIGERLQEARRRATAAEREVDLLPVLRSRREQVEQAVAELFPKVRATRSNAPVDAGGWYAGRSAAERADVAPRRAPLS